MNDLPLEYFFKLVTFSGMANDPRKTQPVTADQIGSIVEELERFVVSLKMAANVARTQPEETLGIYYWNSAEIGLARLASFVKAAEESQRAAKLGKPMEIGQLKPRSTGKTSKEMIDKAVKKTTEHRKKPKS